MLWASTARRIWLAAPPGEKQEGGGETGVSMGGEGGSVTPPKKEQLVLMQTPSPLFFQHRLGF